MDRCLNLPDKSSNAPCRGKFFFSSKKDSGCAKWADDTTAQPSLKFELPKRLF